MIQRTITITLGNQGSEKAWNRLQDAVADAEENGELVGKILDALDLPPSLEELVEVRVA